MLSVYLLVLLVFPVLALYDTKPREDADVLLTRSDSAFLRGIAACFVVFAHLCEWLNNGLGSMDRYFYFAAHQLGGIGVLIFFFVSGYGIHKSTSTPPPRDYLWKRAKTAYLPYLILEALFEFFHCVVIKDRAIGLSQVLSILFCRQIIDPSRQSLSNMQWFIAAILIQYIVYYFLKKRFDGKALLVSVCIADCVASVVFIAFHAPDRWFNAMWLFAAGIAAAQYERQLLSFLSKRLWPKTVLSLVGFVLFGGIFALFKGALFADLFKPLSGILLCLALCGVLQRLSFRSRVMNYLGKRSLYIYVIHVNIILLLPVPDIPRFWLVIALSLVLSEIMFRVIEPLTSRLEAAVKKSA